MCPGPNSKRSQLPWSPHLMNKCKGLSLVLFLLATTHKINATTFERAPDIGYSTPGPEISVDDLPPSPPGSQEGWDRPCAQESLIEALKYSSNASEFDRVIEPDLDYSQLSPSSLLGLADEADFSTHTPLPSPFGEEMDTSMYTPSIPESNAAHRYLSPFLYEEYSNQTPVPSPFGEMDLSLHTPSILESNEAHRRLSTLRIRIYGENNICCCCCSSSYRK